MGLTRGLVGCVSLLAAGCHSASLEGATLAPSSATAKAAPVARYVPEACRDARGRPAPAPALTVERLERASGRPALLELRPGYDSLLVERPVSERNAWVFRFTTESLDGPTLVHELRIAAAKTEPGRLRIADDFDGELDDQSLRLREQSVLLDCQLIAEKDAPLDTPRALE